MAIEYLKELYREEKNELRKLFERKILVGVEYKGKTRYCLLDEDVETLKWMVENKKFPGKVVYVGRIKFDGEEPELEEVDLSQVKYKGFKLKEKGKQMIEEFREETRRKLGIEAERFLK